MWSDIILIHDRLLSYECILYFLKHLLKERSISKKLVEEIKWNTKGKKSKKKGIKEQSIEETKRKQIAKW